MAVGSYEGAVLSDHAASQMVRRGIPERLLRRVLDSPDQVADVRPGRVVLQSVVTMGIQRCLVRVFVDVDRRRQRW